MPRKERNSKGDLVWRADVTRTIAGKRVRKTKVCRTREIALRWERKITDDLEGRALGDRGVLTIGKLWESYIEFAELAKVSWKSDVSRWGPFVEFVGAETPATAITQADLMRYLKERCESLSQSTRSKILYLISRVYRYGCENGALVPPYNPAIYLRIGKADPPRQRVLSDDELLTILSWLMPEHRAIFLVARFTGLRRGHIMALRWEDIKSGLIRLGGEDNKRAGVVPVPDGLFDLVPVAAGKKRTGRLWTITHPHKAIQRAQKRAGVAEWRFHDLRRTYATHLRQMGVDSDVRRVIMGHAPDRSSEVHSRYQVVSENEIRDAGRRIESSESYQRLLRCARQMHSGHFVHVNKHKQKPFSIE